MKYIVLNMSATFMSFGNNDCGAKNFIRSTGEFPTISSIYGILCTAFGISNNKDFINKLNQLVSVEETYSYTETKILEDYQNIGGGWVNKSDKWDKENKCKNNPYKNMIPHNNNGETPSNGISNQIAHKYYLVNPHFRVLIKINDGNFADEIVEKLKHPVWKTICFGRRNCIPNRYLFDGIFDNKEDAIEKIHSEHPLYKYVSDKPEKYDYAFGWIKDIPINSFDDKKSYGMRRVYKVKIAIPSVNNNNISDVKL